MNIQLPLVTFDIAKELKEVGFDVPTPYYYHRNIDGTLLGGFDHESENYNDAEEWNKHYVSRPDLYTVQIWLREVHGLYCYATPSNETSEWCGWFYRIIEKGGYNFTEYQSPLHDTHDSALTAAIQHCLKLIKERK